MKHLVVSIHDVSPLTQETTAQILDDLHALGVPHMSLLVVPDHHHRVHFLHQPDFCKWLTAQSHDGHEAVIHGYFHQRARRHGESSRSKFITRFYTADEGEFYDIDEVQARELVKKARYEFAQIGLHPSGFIAPAWLLSVAAERALHALGIDYTTRLATILDLKNSRTHRSQSLVWSVRSRWRRSVSLAWNASLFERLRTNPLMRVSIHPTDLQHAKIWLQVRTLISRALEERAPITYQNWIDIRRSAS